MILRIFFRLVTMSILVASCSMTFEVGMEPLPSETASATAPAATDTPLPTATPAVPTSTATLPASPTAPPTPTQAAPTDTPAPTPLPGSAVIPITSMGSDIPWLPVDRSRWPTVHVVTFNTHIPPFDNLLVRQAFAASIDKDVIVEMAEGYYAVDPSPATTFLHPQILGRDLYGEVGIVFDPVRARELMTQAGYADTAAFPTITLLVTSYGDIAPGARFNMASAMAEMWRTHLGVNVEVQALGWDPYMERVRSDPPELFWIGWLPWPGNDPELIGGTYHTDADNNYGHFSNPDFDALVDRAAETHDPALRQALYIQAERILCELEAGTIPLYHTFSNIP